jgi:hypothetical protein
MWNQNYTVEKQLEIGVIEPFVKNPKWKTPKGLVLYVSKAIASFSTFHWMFILQEIIDGFIWQLQQSLACDSSQLHYIFGYGFLCEMF